MALIGPRPLLPKYLPLYSKEQFRRHEVRPGITGWAQVNGRNNISWQRKFELDVWYVDHLSFALDAKIFFLTIKKVLVREDINMEGEAPRRLSTDTTDRETMQVCRFVNSVFQSNTYVLTEEGCKDACLVDAGDVEPVERFLRGHGLRLVSIFLTHCHYDHIYGVKRLLADFPACCVYTSVFGRTALADAPVELLPLPWRPVVHCRRAGAGVGRG